MIELTDLVKQYGKKEVLNIKKLTIEKGHICGLFGLNGAGKTTLMKIICRLTQMTSGNVSIDGLSINDKTYESNVGFTIESPAFFPNLSGYANLKLLSKLYNGISNDKIIEVISLVGLDKNKDISYKKYSMGMKQRLYFAYAIMNDPCIVILDEPFNGIDPITTELLKKVIVSMKEKGTTFLISSHGIGELKEICDDAIIIDKGKIIYQTDDAKNTDLKNIFISMVDNSGEI